MSGTLRSGSDAENLQWQYERLRDAGRGYDAIGQDYTAARRTDPTWEVRLWSKLDEAGWVLNVGAGAGSYESHHPRLVAVEPSGTMRRQRPSWAAPCVNARAEDLPFDDKSFDVAMAILTIHHWSDLERGIEELKRVAHRYLVLTYDMAVQRNFWLTANYIPEIADAEEQRVPSIAAVRDLFGSSCMEPMLVPAQCTDGFATAYWRRPWLLLKPTVRQSCSALALTDSEAVDRGLRELERDLADGSWYEKHAELLSLEAWDAGFRLITGPA